MLFQGDNTKEVQPFTATRLHISLAIKTSTWIWIWIFNCRISGLSQIKKNEASEGCTIDITKIFSTIDIYQNIQLLKGQFVKALLLKSYRFVFYIRRRSKVFYLKA